MFNFKNYGPVERDKKKKIAIIIAVCTVVLILAVAVALVVSIVANRSNTPDNNNGGNTNDDGDNGGTIVNTTQNYSFNATKSGTLLVINKNSNPFDFELNSTASFKEISANIPKVNNVAVYQTKAGKVADETALSALNNMLTAFYNNTETDKAAAAKITVYEAYRSYDDQEALNSSTKGGHSDFHTGMLFDLRADGASINTAAYKWIYDNAHKYGFVQRYPDAKKDATGVSGFDHAFRYVGVAHATYMKSNDLCLEEYVELLKTKTASSPLKVATNCEVYYVAANQSGDTALPLSTSRNTYTVSGDNNGGFIVTKISK